MSMKGIYFEDFGKHLHGVISNLLDLRNIKFVLNQISVRKAY